MAGGYNQVYGQEKKVEVTVPLPRDNSFTFSLEKKLNSVEFEQVKTILDALKNTLVNKELDNVQVAT